MDMVTRAELLARRNGLADQLASLRGNGGWVNDADADLVLTIRQEKAALDAQLDIRDAAGELPLISHLFRT